MDAKTIREKFLDFFEQKNHKVVPSAPIVVQNDPTLMFTNAGMNQFKDYFLGNKKPKVTRIADTQKCLRVSGKHNDLEEVGFDTYHHTMFEMLGNWSFGDYFKEEAIDWAWELLTEVYGLPKDRLYATIFEGDTSEELEADREAKAFWLTHLPEDRILNGNKKDNFWEMGDSGPCGPCSEIHIDLRPQFEIEKMPGQELVNQDHPLVVEIWNLVFMQFNRLADGSLVNLPECHVDTGMGFERLAMAIQGKSSNYDTDVFTPLINKVAEMAGRDYGDDPKTDIAMRVIADHLRAICFTIADGQLPSNAKAGYVIRRILRRAVRYGYTFLNFREPFLTNMVSTLSNQFNEIFPELRSQENFVSKVVREEEVSFLRTLENGLKRFEAVKATGAKRVLGTDAFELYDTYGFPFDLTRLIASENEMDVDEDGFLEEMKKQKDRSKAAGKQEMGDWLFVTDVEGDSEFIGYEYMTSNVQIVKYRTVKQNDQEIFQVVFDQTPFYAESGGQVGDKGQLKNSSETIQIFDTKKENELIVHFTDSLPKELVGTWTASVNESERGAIQNNHSATHLLHAALRSVLGNHVQQRGSLVNDQILRFDFSHFSKMSEEEVTQAERIVNQKIRENISLDEKRNVPIEDAKKLGAMALFGEKYGDFVRVITFDSSYSVELCGGTHVKATGEIGYFKIISESSIAAGVRRIEAFTGEAAESYISSQLDVLQDVQEILKKPKDTVKSIQDLVAERNALQKQLEKMSREKAQGIKGELMSRVEELKGMKFISYEGEFVDATSVKQLAFDLKHETENLILLIGSKIKDKPGLTVMLSDELAKEKSLNASEIVRKMAQEIKGGGGGQPFYATAGGKDVSGLSKALEVGKELILEKLS